MAQDRSQQPSFQRMLAEMSYGVYSRIVVRKHGLLVELPDPTSLSDEELRAAVDQLRDMAHLPPA